jgi:hypothetical protein
MGDPMNRYGPDIGRVNRQSLDSSIAYVANELPKERHDLPELIRLAFRLRRLFG